MTLEFLDELESRVRDAAERIEELTTENGRLLEQVDKLSEELEAARESAPDAWFKEREEARRRLAAVVERLSALLKAR